MKNILALSLLLVITGCYTSQVYLPHTSRTFHKKNCVACTDPHPIEYPSAQAALSTGGISPCSVCITAKDFAVKQQGYTSTNFSTMPGQIQASSGSSNPPASSIGHKIGKAFADALQDYNSPEAKSQRQLRNHQRNVERQMRQQNSILQQQLELQQKQQRQLEQPPFIPLYKNPIYSDDYNNYLDTNYNNRDNFPLSRKYR